MLDGKQLLGGSMKMDRRSDEGRCGGKRTVSRADRRSCRCKQSSDDAGGTFSRRQARRRCCLWRTASCWASSRSRIPSEDSAAAIRDLRNLGLRVVMLTGDNEKRLLPSARRFGVDEVIAGVLPDGKERVIRDLKNTGKS